MRNGVGSCDNQHNVEYDYAEPVKLYLLVHCEQSLSPEKITFSRVPFTASSTTKIFITGTVGGGSATINLSSSNPAGVTGYSSNFLDFTNDTTFTNQNLAISLDRCQQYGDNGKRTYPEHGE